MQGIEAVDALLEATPETPSYMIGTSENKVTRVPLMEAVALVRLGTFSVMWYWMLRRASTDTVCGHSHRSEGLQEGEVVA